MSKKRYFVVAGLLAILVCGGIGITLMLQPDPVPGVTKANFDRIQDGMTETEVQTILGGPGFPYSSFPFKDKDTRDHLQVLTGRLTFYVELPKGVKGVALEGSYFHTPRSAAYIGISNGHVDGKKWFSQDESVIDKIRRWLRL